MLPPIGLQSPAEVLSESVLESSALTGCLSGRHLEAGGSFEISCQKGRREPLPVCFPLLVPERLDRVEPPGADGRVETGGEAEDWKKPGEGR